MVCKDKNTIIVNLFGGPGTGKSTSAALLFGRLKQLNIDCELVREYAKDLVWEERSVEFKNQLCIMGKQIKKIDSIVGKVDIIVLDSPILLSAYYNNLYDPELFNQLVLVTHNLYDNLNINLQRIKDYNPNGRFQTEAEANVIAQNITSLLDVMGVPHHNMEADEKCVSNILKLIANKRPSLFIDLNKYESVFDAVYDMDKIIENL